MTDQLPEEVFIVGYRYRDNADDVSKLFKLNRPIEKKDIIEVFGDDSAFLKPVESDIDPYCVAVYDIETNHIGYVWMLQAPTMRRWMETHNEDFISIRITGTIPAANVLLGVMEEPLDVPLTNREFNDFDPSWASNLPGILRGDSEECLDMQLKLLCKELSKAKKWNKIFEKSISNLFKSIPLDLSSYRHNTYMELFVKMRKSEIKEVREKSDEMLKTLLYRGSKEYMKWWTEEWLTEYFRKVSEGHLFKLFEAAHYTLDVVEDLLEKAPANLYHLYKADKIEFVRRLYYYALPKDAYNRLLTLLAVREALLENEEDEEIQGTTVTSKHDKEFAKCFNFPSEFTKHQLETVVKTFYHGEHADLALMEITLFDHGQLKKRNSHTALVNGLVYWGLIKADKEEQKQIISGIKDKYKRLPTDGYKMWGDIYINDKNRCCEMGKILGETMKYQR